MTAGLALLCHLAFETTVWPKDSVEWLSVVLLGLLPVGAAFFTWDYGVKHGNIQILGAASYASPLLSTIILVLAGRTQLTLTLALACVLITLGAIWASKDMLFKRGVPAGETV
jgi:drug/metabolite transporter (DMT)-like permease